MPEHAEDEPLDYYTTEPTHIRIFDEGDGWALDAADDNGNYTEACWKFDTQAEAMRTVPEFIKALQETYGCTIKWRNRKGDRNARV